MTCDQKIGDYWELPGFEQVYLEDSYVNDIACSFSQIKFELELILREAHPQYEAPKPNEQYCYKAGLLIFENVFSMNLHTSNIMRSVDPGGSVDYGNIDVFEAFEDNYYRLAGSWGKLLVKADAPRILLKYEILNFG